MTIINSILILALSILLTYSVYLIKKLDTKYGKLTEKFFELEDELDYLNKCLGKTLYPNQKDILLPFVVGFEKWDALLRHLKIKEVEKEHTVFHYKKI